MCTTAPACSVLAKRMPRVASSVNRPLRMASALDLLIDDRFETSTAIIFVPMAETIFLASCSSAVAQFCAYTLELELMSNIRTNGRRLISCEKDRFSMPAMREL